MELILGLKVVAMACIAWSLEDTNVTLCLTNN